MTEFERIRIPLIRRVYPRLIVDQIISVQPLLGPTSLTYYQRFRYSWHDPNYSRDRDIRIRPLEREQSAHKVNWLKEGF